MTFTWPVTAKRPRHHFIPAASEAHWWRRRRRRWWRWRCHHPIIVLIESVGRSAEGKFHRNKSSLRSPLKNWNPPPRFLPREAVVGLIQDVVCDVVPWRERRFEWVTTGLERLPVVVWWSWCSRRRRPRRRLQRWRRCRRHWWSTTFCRYCRLVATKIFDRNFRFSGAI